MKFKEKLLILIVAVIVSVLGFNLIASSYVCLLKAANEACYETIESHQTRCDVHSHQSPHPYGNHGICEFDSIL